MREKEVFEGSTPLSRECTATKIIKLSGAAFSRSITVNVHGVSAAPSWKLKDYEATDTDI